MRNYKAKRMDHMFTQFLLTPFGAHRIRSN